MIKEKLIPIIKEIQQSIKETHLDQISDDKILEIAEKIMISQNINDSMQGKYNTSKSPLSSPTVSKNVKFEPLTDKQKSLLLKMKYDGDTSKLSKEEAKVLISEEIERRKTTEYGEDY